MSIVPINGLQDLLLWREYKKQQSPLYALANGVAQGIEEARMEQKKKKQIQENMAKFYGQDAPATNEYKISKSIDLETGELSQKISNKTSSEIKSERDLARQETIDKRVTEYVQGDIDFDEFITTPGIQEVDMQELTQIKTLNDALRQSQPKVKTGETLIGGGKPILSTSSGQTRVPRENEGILEDLGVDTGDAFPQPTIDDIFEPSLEYKAKSDIWKTWNSEITKNEKTMVENYGSLKGLTQMVIAQWKAAAKEKIEKGIPTGLAQKVMSGVADTFELEGYPQTKAYIGARIEYALNATKIITGGSRIVRDIFNNILKTEPTDTGITEDAYSKLRQSIHANTARAAGRSFSMEEQDLINADFQKLWEGTPAARIPDDVSIGTANYRTSTGDTLYNVPIEEVPRLVQEFEWIEEIQ